MIPRAALTEFMAQMGEFPVVTVLGPRQAGKTTLVRNALPDYAYVNLESPDTRELARDDPRALLRRYGRRVIFDEVQRAPELLSYIQATVDESTDAGQFVLTGSHQLSLRQAISQSLAGRTTLLHLLPLSIAELSAARISFDTASEYIYQGFLPRIYDQKQRPTTAYRAYYQTYIERDVRQLIQLKDVSPFEKFIKLLAGRVGQLMNYQSLGNDVGVDAKTIKQWLSILEASFVVFKLEPYFENFGKRATKTPKYYFTDTGLLAYLLGIEKPAQVERDPLFGQLFENLVVLEALKARYNRGQEAGLYFFRDSNGNEVDLLYKAGNQLHGVEIKSAVTWHKGFKTVLNRFDERTASLIKRAVIYSGDALEFSDGVRAINFINTATLFGGSNGV